jgi:hypothetical protein
MPVDQVALVWGFDRELQAFLSETGAQAAAAT